ncbi:trypsin-like serine peptidase [Noviherbaspirillum suwonense]|uniref:Serine protease n=1 Tax=Noviherbaspirillum suwonense TaxID=1224511 RepID=A0ABY1QWN2_9BURK|nr:serine protease [Noviherbaspirillum suwonense]SMP81214.1 V8-like Glu-specific endopeptidase [Noviherbaspirillum suwonense]
MCYRVLFAYAIVAMGTLNCLAFAQPSQEGRAPAILGNVQQVAQKISLSGKNGSTSVIVSGLPTARTIKLRLDYLGGSSVPLGVFVVIRDAGSNEVARYSGEQLAEEGWVWSPLLKGAAAKVEVLGQVPEQATADFQAVVTAVASNVPLSRPTLNIVREFDLEDIEYIKVNQPEIFEAGRAVAKISFVTSKGPAACTGFMVSESQMLTNYHCINTHKLCKSADVIFGFDKPDMPLGQERQKCLRLVDKDPDLDAALIEVAGSPGQRWGVLQFSPDGGPTVPEAAVVVQHPAGLQKFVSRTDCVVATMPAPGVKTESDFGHSCDTMEGSSGSPVLRRKDLKVIGLHHWGFVAKATKWNAENRAVQISGIKKRFGL